MPFPIFPRAVHRIRKDESRRFVDDLIYLDKIERGSKIQCCLYI